MPETASRMKQGTSSSTGDALVQVCPHGAEPGWWRPPVEPLDGGDAELAPVDRPTVAPGLAAGPVATPDDAAAAELVAPPFEVMDASVEARDELFEPAPEAVDPELVAPAAAPAEPADAPLQVAAVDDVIPVGPTSHVARVLMRFRSVGLARVLVFVGVAAVGAAWLWAGGSSSVFGSEQDALDCVAAVALLAGGVGAVVFAIRGVLAGGHDDV